jgi:hypothetical protein
MPGGGRRFERQGELCLCYWVESGAGYALVGALPRERLLALAEATYRQQPVPVAAGTAGSAPASGARWGAHPAARAAHRIGRCLKPP